VKLMLAVKEKIIAREKTIPASHENLSLSLRNLILDEITENVFEQTPKVNQLAARIRDEILITPLTKREAYVHVIGVDAGSQVIPLASRQYAVIGALAYALPDGKRFFLSPESLSEPYSAQYNFRSLVDIRREALTGSLSRAPRQSSSSLTAPLRTATGGRTRARRRTGRGSSTP